MSKTAVIIVSRNNARLLGHAIQHYQKHPAGAPCDFYIVDAGSDDAAHKSLLARQTLANVVLYRDNDRVEVNFDIMANALLRNCPEYDSFFFAHDDNVPIADNWLRPFVEKLESGYVEEGAPDWARSLPIGRVGGLSQYWRGYNTVQGFPIACPFLRPAAEVVTGKPAPEFFKYADCDRVLVSKECLEATDGLVTLQKLTSKLPELTKIFDAFLHYPDDGMYPKTKYPPGNYWNKLTLLSEFMNSVLPLMRGYRTVGVDSDGYLEQIHGEAEPWGNRFIAHYGSPNSLKALATVFQTDTDTVKKRFHDPVVLQKSYNYFRNYYAESAHPANSRV